MEIDWDDPCAAATELRRALNERLVGGADVRVRIRSGEHEEEVQSAVVSIADLKAALASAEQACAAKRGERPRRFAIGAGFRR